MGRGRGKDWRASKNINVGEKLFLISNFNVTKRNGHQVSNSVRYNRLDISSDAVITFFSSYNGSRNKFQSTVIERETKVIARKRFNR